MSQATELTNQIIDFIYRHNGYAWRNQSQGLYDRRTGAFRMAAKRGTSDILACVSGRLLAIEVKIGRDRLSPEQDGFLKNVIHAGGIAFVVKNFDDFLQQWGNMIYQKLIS